jgi:uncharacterized protein (TIGR02246 family)
MTASPTARIALSCAGRLARALICYALLLALPAPRALAQPDKATTEIRTALTAWTQAFNTGNAAEVCRLFAPDLRYDFRGLPEQNYRDICARLRRSLADPAVRRLYAPDIKEILVSGNLAVVRLVWRVTTSRRGHAELHTAEPGLDVFRREPDGAWRIIRFLAYEAPG